MKDLQTARAQEELDHVQLRQQPAPRKQHLQSEKEYPFNSDWKCVHKTSESIVFEHDLMLVIDRCETKNDRAQAAVRATEVADVKDIE